MSEWASVHIGDVVNFVNGDRSTNYPKGSDYVPEGWTLLTHGFPLTRAFPVQ